MSMTGARYNAFIKQIEAITAHGTKEQLQTLYAQIFAQTGDRENLRRLDSLHNRRWTMDI